MPTYTFLNTKTKKEFDITMSISERDKYVSENPHLQQVLKTMNVVDPTRLGIQKPDNGFRDLLKDMKKKHSGGITKSTINTF
jgi:hypothetical protein